MVQPAVGQAETKKEWLREEEGGERARLAVVVVGEEKGGGCDRLTAVV